MLIRKKFAIWFVSLSAALTLAACGGNDGNSGVEDTSKEEGTANNESSGHSEGHAGMDHSGSGDVPEGIKEAENPKYEVGSKAFITEGHMEGMEGAKATISGAYDTTVYTVSYTPATGGKKVENHKWVVHEEIADAGEEPFKEGEEVILNASHMNGMEGAAAEIDSVQETTVYMVDFTTADGQKVKNHMWVTESELSPAE
ncbi:MULTISPECIES: YdhK family protein [unclassified Cytobacillus]|uniref:YdhK family protein n=1 Tax=unclassified Cytobacillus TaxID=2675268 RepID=UPI0020404DAC|nr:YdhK family protein [Cytobacillus sp. AMY 15.2]MCM3091624.1 YdhK family protein [Cytobacillus sp. AMY 15.2]